MFALYDVFCLILLSSSIPHFLTMRLKTVLLWRFVYVLVLLIPLTTCDRPEPVCHASLGQNLHSTYCLEAIKKFYTHRNAVLGTFTKYTATKTYAFTDIRTARARMGLSLVQLPLNFFHEGCGITIYMPVTTRVNPVSASWGNVNNAIRYLFRKCVDRGASTGGIVVYQGLGIVIAQYSRTTDSPDLSHRQIGPIPMASDMRKAIDIINNRSHEQARS
jgi:hypothetical protein